VPEIRDDNSRDSERAQSSQYHNHEMQIQENAEEPQDSAVTEEFAVELVRHSTDQSSQEHCEEDGVTVECQDSIDLVVEQCGLVEVRPHLQEVSIPTLPVVDLETEYAAHEAPPSPVVEETQPSRRVPLHGENCGCLECQIDLADGEVAECEHEAESELEREGNCVHSPLLRPGGMIFLEEKGQEQEFQLDPSTESASNILQVQNVPVDTKRMEEKDTATAGLPLDAGQGTHESVPEIRDDNSRDSERAQSSQYHNHEMQIQENAEEPQDSAVTEEFAVELVRHSTDQSSQEHCEEDGVTVECQDSIDLVVEQCGLVEVRPHLQEVSIPTLPVVDLETEYAAHEAPPSPVVEETQPSGQVTLHGQNCGCLECQIEMSDGKVDDVEHEAVSELERKDNCAHSPLLRLSGMIFLEDAHEATMIADGIIFPVEGDELEPGERVADDVPSDDGARDDDEVDHGCCCLRHRVVALPNDCSGHELENSSQDEIVPEEFGNKPEVVFSSSVSTCPSLAAGLERDETVERNEQSDDKQDEERQVAAEYVARVLLQMDDADHLHTLVDPYGGGSFMKERDSQCQGDEPETSVHGSPDALHTRIWQPDLEPSPSKDCRADEMPALALEVDGGYVHVEAGPHQDNKMESGSREDMCPATGDGPSLQERALSQTDHVSDTLKGDVDVIVGIGIVDGVQEYIPEVQGAQGFVETLDLQGQFADGEMTVCSIAINRTLESVEEDPKNCVDSLGGCCKEIGESDALERGFVFQDLEVSSRGVAGSSRVSVMLCIAGLVMMAAVVLGAEELALALGPEPEIFQ